jgi:GTP-dependent dephospho-CoA kinase
LAVIPLVIAANEGTVILYGQPGEGVVFRLVDREAKEKARDMLTYFINSPE